MRVSLIGLIVLIGGQTFGQSLFGDYARKTDSLNIINFYKLKPTGQLDAKGTKTGFWVEYKILSDTTANPVILQGINFSLNMEYRKPSTLEKAEGAYASGQMTSQWKWFEAIYLDDSLTWLVTRETIYDLGQKNGIEREFSLGEIFREASYSMNKIVGTEILYYPPGVIYAKVQWKDGIAKNATWYFQDGQIKTTKDYAMFPLTRVTDYHENGKVKTKYTVFGNEEIIDGEYRMFDKNGKLIEKKTFDKGTVVEK